MENFLTFGLGGSSDSRGNSRSFFIESRHHFAIGGYSSEALDGGATIEDHESTRVELGLGTPMSQHGQTWGVV
jgi:hypothetical protein